MDAGMREDAIMAMRDELFAHIKKKYRTNPEYLWVRFPGCAVFSPC